MTRPVVILGVGALQDEPIFVSNIFFYLFPMTFFNRPRLQGMVLKTPFPKGHALCGSVA